MYFLNSRVSYRRGHFAYDEATMDKNNVLSKKNKVLMNQNKDLMNQIAILSNKKLHNYIHEDKDLIQFD